MSNYKFWAVHQSIIMPCLSFMLYCDTRTHITQLFLTFMSHSVPPRWYFNKCMIVTPVKCHLKRMSSWIPLPYDSLVTEDLCSSADIWNSYIDIQKCRMTWKGQSKISLSSHNLCFWFCQIFTRSLAHAWLSLHWDIRATPPQIKSGDIAQASMKCTMTCKLDTWGP